MGDAFKPQWFHILVALADQPRHGYGIQRDVLARTDGEIMLWPAMLYRSLAALAERNLVEPVEEPDGAEPDERRRYYRITEAGQERLNREAAQLQKWVEVTKQRTAGEAG